MHRIAFPAALAALACAAGCTINETTTPMRSPQQAPPAYSYTYTTTTSAPTVVPVAPRPTLPSLDDAQIVAVLNESDRSDIAQANFALQQSKDERARRLAGELRADHERAEASQYAIARQLGLVLASSSLSHELDVDAQQTLRTFGPLTGAAFNRSYVDAQVSDHRKMLEIIDGQLLPQAKLPQIATLVRQTRAKVIEHIKLAESVRDEI